MRIVLVKDKEDKGYTAFIKEYPAVIAQGETRDEAINELFKGFAAFVQIDSICVAEQKEFEGYHYEFITVPFER